MRVSLQELRRDLDRLSCELDPRELGLPEDWFHEPISVEARIQPVLSGWKIDLSFASRVQRSCDRCLESFTVPTAGEDRCLVLPAGERLQEEEEDRLIHFTPDQEWVELDQVLRDALRLAQPDYCLCREDCQGLCAQCGLNLNEGSCGCRPPVPESSLQMLASLKRKPSTSAGS